MQSNDTNYNQKFQDSEVQQNCGAGEAHVDTLVPLMDYKIIQKCF